MSNLCPNCGGLGMFDDFTETYLGEVPFYQCESCDTWFYGNPPALEKPAAQQSERRTGFQPPHGHVFIGGKCECGEQVPLPPFARR